jgi:hypothetical protein
MRIQIVVLTRLLEIQVDETVLVDACAPARFSILLQPVEPSHEASLSVA